MLPKNVKYFSTERYLEGGMSTGNHANFNLATYVSDVPASVAANRALLAQHFQLPSEPKWLHQTHSNVCIDAQSNNRNADACVTHQKNVICAVLAADCLPIFASNSSGTQVGVAHAGCITYSIRYPVVRHRSIRWRPKIKSRGRKWRA